MNTIKTYALPLAIVVAGALIAGTIYFTQSKPATQGKTLGDITNDAMKPKVDIAPVTSADHILGPKNAKIKLIVYTDPECPFCKMYHDTLTALIRAHASKGDVAVVYRLFPLDQLHPKARKEAEAFECAADIGGADSFWKYGDALFAITPSNNQLDPAKLYTLADQINLDSQKFKTCLDSGKFASKVSESVASGNSAGAVGTPYTVINIGNEFLPLVDKSGSGVGAIPLAPLERVLTELSKR